MVPIRLPPVIRTLQALLIQARVRGSARSSSCPEKKSGRCRAGRALLFTLEKMSSLSSARYQTRRQSLHQGTDSVPWERYITHWSLQFDLFRSQLGRASGWRPIGLRRLDLCFPSSGLSRALVYHDILPSLPWPSRPRGVIRRDGNPIVDEPVVLVCANHAAVDRPWVLTSEVCRRA